MIEQLRIKNLGVIRDATLDFSPGLTVLTGETGAGKTMVFRSLHLLFGGKADSALISTGAEQASVEADVAIPTELVARLDELGGQVEDGNIAIISRQVNSTGRSRSFAGGASVPAAAVSEMGDALVAVHGQSDQLRLTKTEQQRLLLDRYAGESVAKPMAKYSELWEAQRTLERRIESLTSDAGTRAAQLERITRILEQVDSLKPLPGEDNELDDEAKRLSHTEALYEVTARASDLLTGGQGDDLPVVAALVTARKGLDHERALDATLGEFADRMKELEILAADLSADISAYSSGIDASPQRLAFVESRRAALKTLTREFGDVDDLLKWVEENRPRVAELEGGDEVLGQLREDLAQVKADLVKSAAEITKARTKAAAAFSAQVTGELESLAMPGATVQFKLSPANPGPSGADLIELGLISRPDSPWIPMSKGASGGELSRIMLAVEVVLAAADPTETFVFDEVDAGVGGAAAVEVGKRLARLARNAQVIVVTHLPQVAAFADRHLVIARSDGQEVHSSSVSEVQQGERVAELSRMLAGLADSQAGTQLAEELLALAQVERKAK
ncbi:MAG: DNA repair protein RecN [Actinobacteria bacterium]|nr:DNA repair protein RecN [Actinomycetota bacterium]